jgi:hypothetical protein
MHVQATAEMLDSMTSDLLKAQEAIIASAQEQQAKQANKHSQA